MPNDNPYPATLRTLRTSVLASAAAVAVNGVVMTWNLLRFFKDPMLFGLLITFEFAFIIGFLMLNQRQRNTLLRWRGPQGVRIHRADGTVEPVDRLAWEGMEFQLRDDGTFTDIFCWAVPDTVLHRGDRLEVDVWPLRTAIGCVKESRRGDG